MDRTIILHQLNAVGVSPAEFVGIAGDSGCTHVTMFSYDGSDALPRANSGLTYPTTITPGMKNEVHAALADKGVTLDAVEFFPLTADVDLELYRPALALGAELGARRAASHIFIADDALVVDRLGQLLDIVEEEGLKLTSEFCPMTPGNPSLARAVWLVDQIGRETFGIGVDALHAVRSGATAADLAALDSRYFGIAQICDAKGTHVSDHYIADVHNREVPGQGDLPLHELLSALPVALAIEAEVPAAHCRAAGVTAAEHVRDVLAGTRAVVAGLRPVR